MAGTAVPDLVGTRINKARAKDGSPGVIELICNRKLGLSARVKLGFMPKLSMLGDLVGTDIGEAVLELAAGNTAGDVCIEDVPIGRKTLGCVTINPPFGKTATLADLLDDVLRLAQEPASTVDPQNTAVVLAEITRAFNRYLELIEQGGLIVPAVGCGGVSSRDELSMLWTYFDQPLTRRGEVVLTPELLVRYVRRIIPWMGELLDHLVQKRAITGGDIAVSVQSHGMRLFSQSVSRAHPTALDCLELIAATAEAYSNYSPTEEALIKVSRERRWREQEAPVTDPLARIMWRWSLVLRALAQRAEQA
ncbi:MAG TPA: hypothetical protein VM581_02040 [Magnetospirillaceae bacterium]|nr:hypothetical protein [Magnetospirillaceae bacterium]